MRTGRGWCARLGVVLVRALAGARARIWASGAVKRLLEFGIPYHRQKKGPTTDAVFGRRGREAILFPGVARERTLGRTFSGAVVCTRRQVCSAATARAKREAPPCSSPPSIGRFWLLRSTSRPPPANVNVRRKPWLRPVRS